MVSLVLIGTAEVRGQELSGAMKFGPGVFTLAGEADFQPLPNLAAVGSMRITYGGLVLQPEVQITTRGGMYRVTSETMTGESSVRVDHGITYVDVPVSVGFTPGGAFSPLFYAGPYGGIRVDSQVRLEFTNGGTIDPVRSVHRWDAGVLAGTSAEFETRFYRVIVDLRGLFGMTPVYVSDPGMRHLGAMLLVGIVF